VQRERAWQEAKAKRARQRARGEKRKGFWSQRKGHEAKNQQPNCIEIKESTVAGKKMNTTQS